MGKFVISTRKNGEFQFNLKADNGQVILASEGYKSKSNAVRAINSVFRNLHCADRYNCSMTMNQKHYFKLRNKRNLTLCYSGMFDTETGRDFDIDRCMRVEKIIIEDLTKKKEIK